MRALLISTEPIGSVPRPQSLMDAIQALERGELTMQTLDAMCDQEVIKTLADFANQRTRPLGLQLANDPAVLMQGTFSMAGAPGDTGGLQGTVLALFFIIQIWL